MADISYIQKEDLEDSDEAMEAEDDEEILCPDGSETRIWNSVGGSSDEGGRDEQLLTLQECATSEAKYTRQRVGLMVVEMFRAAVKNGTELPINDIMQSIQQIVDDPDVQIRAELVEILPRVAMFCHEAPHLFGDVLHSHLLGIIIKYLRDLDTQVRQAAQRAILTLMKKGLLDNNTIEVKVCPVVDFLSYMATDFLNSGISKTDRVHASLTKWLLYAVARMFISQPALMSAAALYSPSFRRLHRLLRCAIATVPPVRVVVMWYLGLVSQPALTSGTFMSKMAPLIGKELTEKVFLGRYIALCKDNEFYIRKICVTHFGELCAAVGWKALTGKLLPIFLDLCRDRVWSVRKGCVDVMMPVSCCLTRFQRRLHLADILAMHLNDESKWVRMSAYQILGPFISTFAKQFTEVTYNQHGELVFTSQQDSQSIRYSYEGIFPTKCAIRQMLDTEDYNSKENFDSSVMIQKSIFEDDDIESREDRISAMRDYSAQIRMEDKSMNKKQTFDMVHYNPFMYYYTPPDLPLDDELVQAARRSAAEKAGNNAYTTAASFNDSLNDENDENDDSYSFSRGEGDRIDISGQEIVPQHLIESFLLMAEPGLGSDVGADIPLHCAFSFPAVVLTLGRENWPYLKDAYQTLVNANPWKIRRTLAFSIHEVAAILGEELTTTDLVPIFDGFIRDLDEVRIGVLKHLATFLKILKPSDRCEYLPRLKQFRSTDNEWNWRFREELATQLLAIVNLFCRMDVKRYIVPLSLELLDDKVAAVRQVALSLVTQVIAHLSGNDRLVSAVHHELRRDFGVSAEKWIRRQTYVFVCAQLISNNAIGGYQFYEEMLPSLLMLSCDKVPNVRLAVARTLSRHVITMGPDWLNSKQREEVERKLKQMRLDPDRDVRIFAGGDERPVPDTLS